MELLPAGITVLEGGLLVVVSFFTAAVTAALGIGGGVLFLAVLATIAPPAAVIPVHGVVQFCSNIQRTILYVRHIAWRVVVPFLLGGFLGAAVGGVLVVQLPVPALHAVLGLFLLYSVWAPEGVRWSRMPRWLIAGAGAVTSLLTMFVGATGPFVASVLQPLFPVRQMLIGTHAGCMVGQHGLKVATFGLLGFAFAPWLPMLAAIVVAQFIGLYLGYKLLQRMPEPLFRRIFRLVVTVLAANLLIGAAMAAF